MNVENLRNKYPLLIDHLRANGYTKAYINEFKTGINQFISEATDPRINSYEEYYESLKKKYTKSTLYHKFKIIGMFKQFDSQGLFPTREHSSGFLKEENFRTLSPEFKCVIDIFSNSAKARELSDTYVYHLKLAGAKFFAYQQKNGFLTLFDIPERSVQSYFHDGSKIIRGYSVKKQIEIFLKECTSHFPDGECKRIISFLPLLKNNRKNYPFLEKEETEKIKQVLLDDNIVLSFRDRAIGVLAFYTGLRSCDIAALKLNDINWEKDSIHIIQEKTGIPLTLPLRPVVGNAIYDYIKHERPDTEEETIFLTTDKKTRKLRGSSIYKTTVAIMDRAGVRVVSGRKGIHLFRHNFVVSMLNNGVQSPVITEVLGHKSPKSIEFYLHSDMTSLKRCALSIEKYPVGKEVFGE